VAAVGGCAGSDNGERFTLPLEDDFSGSSTGWPIVDDEVARTELDDGRYSVQVKRPSYRQNIRYFFEPDADGVRVELTAAAPAAPAGYGVTCWTSGTTAYALGLDPSGDYSIAKVVEDEEDQVLAQVDADLDLEQAHQIRGDCVARGGGRPVLTLTVDGQAVAEARDTRAFATFRGVGLFAATGSAPAEVTFDEFSAREE
jgi:hypothetical protein